MKERPQIGRFSFLLAMLASLLIGAPVLQQLSQVPGFRLLFTGLYAAGLAAVSRRRRVFWIGMALALPAVGSEWLTLVTERGAFVVLNTTSSALFLAYTAGVILHTILLEQRVTGDTVLGGLCIYLLIGIFFVEIYTLIEFLQPGSFAIGGVPLPAVGEDVQYARFAPTLYYSFVTLTTLGYGDVTPLSDHARSLAATEAVAGQLYVAVFIARLVGLHLAEGRRRS